MANRYLARSAILLILCGLAQFAQALPPGFQRELVVSGINQPVYLDQLPDGRMLVISKVGTIYLFDPSQTPAQLSTYLTINNVDSYGERGVQSLAIDPDFATSGAIYVYYTNSVAARNRISRFIHTGNTADPLSETVIWQDNEQVTDCCHYGGGFQFGPDGKLYLTTGEMFIGAQSQDLTRAGGKILRINKDGSAPPDNPFVDGPGGNLDEIWAYGLRNPYRAHWDLVKGRLYISEVGGNVQETAREDIHIGRAGANYGWPYCEGYCNNSAYDDPIFSYGHEGSTPNGGAVTAGTVYRGDLFPASYNEVFFYADYVMGVIRYLTFDATGNLTGDFDFANSSDGLGAPVHVIEGADDALYYVDYYGSVNRIVYSSGNQAPIITSATATPMEGNAPLSVNFNALAEDLEGAPLFYYWSFGNGDSEQGQNVNYIYPSKGTFNAYVQVSDGDRSVISPMLNIQVGLKPVINIESPIDSFRFRAGDVIDFIGSGTDPDGILDQNDFEWSIDFIHNAHTHPTLAGYTGTTGQFSINTSGHDYHDDTAYRLTLKVTDADGLVSTDSITLYPDKVDLHLSTEPAGIPVFIDGIPLNTPFSYDTLIGFNHVISVPQSYCLNGESYSFTGWSNGGASTHSLAVPDTDYTDLATFQYQGPCLQVPNDGLVFRVEGTSGVQTNGSVVTGWLDQSGRGNHLSATGDPTLIAAGLNGKDIVNFDGNGDYLFRAGALNGLPSANADRTMVALLQYRSVGFGGVAYGDAICNNAFGLGVDNRGRMGVENWCNFFSSNQNVVNTGWILQAAVLENGQVTHYKNDQIVGSFNHTFATPLTKIILGANLDTVRKMNMQIAGVYIYDRALDTSELNSVRQYLEQIYSVNVGGGTNIAPVAQNDVANTLQGETVAISVLSNDSDEDGALAPNTVSITTNPSRGSVNVDGSTGIVTYIHDGSPTTSDSFSYTVRDNGNLTSNIATVTVSITLTDPVAPVATDDNATVPKGTSNSIDILTNDSDVNGDLNPASVEIMSGPAAGSVSIDQQTGMVIYTHNGSDITSDEFTYRVSDQSGLVSNNASVTITILGNGANVPASGLVLRLEADQGVTSQGGIITGWSDLSGMGNDLTQVSGNPQWQEGVLNGHAVVDFDGTGDELRRTLNLSGLPSGNADRTMLLVVNYRGNGYGGFSYGQPACNQTFGLGVSPQGRLMVQGWCTDHISATTGAGSGWIIQAVVLSAGQATHYSNNTVVGSWQNVYNTVLNRLVLGAEIDGTPQVNMQVAAAYIYDRALRPQELATAHSALRAYYLDAATALPPVAANDTAVVDQGGSVAINVLTNDSDSDGTLVVDTLALVTAPTQGTAVVDTATGSVNYAHNGGTGTSDSFSYTVADNEGLASNVATVNITISPAVAVAPVAADDAFTVGRSGSHTIAVLANDSDANGDLNPATVTIVNSPIAGNVSIDTETGAITYTHNGSFTSSDSFSYQVEDQGGLISNIATVTVSIMGGNAGLPSSGLVLQLEANQGVSSTDGTLTGWSDLSGQGNHLDQVSGDPQWLAGSLNGHAVVDFDGNGDQLRRTLNLAGLPAGNADRTLLLVVNYRGNGYGGFTYGESACNQTFGLGVSPNGRLMVQGWCSDFITPTSGTGTGWIVHAVVLTEGYITHYRNGSVIGTAQHNFNTALNRIVLGAEIDGTPQVNMQVAAAYIYDRGLSTQEISDAYTKLNAYYLIPEQPPTVQNDSADVVQGATVVIDILANDSDANANLSPDSVTLVETPAHGIAEIDPVTGVITYQHGGASTTPDSFSYTVSDDTGLVSNTATVDIGVLAPNAAVSITSPAAGQVIYGTDIVVTYTLSGSDFDHLHLSMDGQGHNTIRDLTGTYVFTNVTPGTHTISAQLVNGSHQPLITDDAFDSVTFIVEPALAAPVAVDDIGVVNSGANMDIDVLANDSDINGNLNPASVEIVSQPSAGTVSVNPVTGLVTYAHDGGGATTDSFTYRMYDLTGLTSNVATVAITILTGTVGVPDQGLVLRLEADQGVSFTAGAVSGWTDLSGAGNHLTQFAGDPLRIENALNGHPVLDFDGVEDHLFRTGNISGIPIASGDRTMVVVVNYRGRGYGGLTYGTPACNQTFGLGVAKYGAPVVQGWCYDVISHGVPGTGGGWMIQAVVLSGNALRHYKNGALIASAQHTYNTTAERLVLGAEIDGSPQVNMQIAAAYIYNRALSEQELGSITALLGNHFAISQ